MVNKINP